MSRLPYVLRIDSPEGNPNLFANAAVAVVPRRAKCRKCAARGRSHGTKRQRASHSHFGVRIAKQGAEVRRGRSGARAQPAQQVSDATSNAAR